jgi:hypothetical protein
VCQKFEGIASGITLQEIEAQSDFLSNHDALSEWPAKEVTVILVAYTISAQHRVTSTYAISKLCADMGFASATSDAIRKLWAHCDRLRHPACGKFHSAANAVWRADVVALTDVSDHMQTSMLSDDLTLDSVQTLLDVILDRSEEEVMASRKQHQSSLDDEAAPWRHIATDPKTVETLSMVAELVLASDTGFVPLPMIMDFVKARDCGWGRWPNELVAKLLRYLPLVYVHFADVESESSTEAQYIAARPPGGRVYLSQIARLAATTHNAATNTEKRLKELPIKDFLVSMECEKDRRVFKGLVAKLTSPTFVKQTFQWNYRSMSRVCAELDLVDVFLVDLNSLLTSVQYNTEISLSKRKRMRRTVRMKSDLSQFLARKRGTDQGGRPSLIDEYS